MPDRIVPLRARRNHSPLPLIAGLLVAGVLIGSLFFWPINSPEPVKPPPDQATPRIPGNKPRQPPEQAFEPEFQRRTFPAPTIDEQWQALAKTCRYWTRQASGSNASSTDRAFQQSACSRQQAYAAQHGIEWTAPRVASPPRRETAPDVSVRVYVNECEQFRYGSVDYRRCRANERQRLENQCNAVTTQWNRANGERRMRLDDFRMAWCSAARHYQIVK